MKNQTHMVVNETSTYQWSLVFSILSLIRDLRLESEKNLIGCGVPRNNCFEISGKDEPDPSRAEEGMRAAAPAARKPYLFETAGHQSGRRVWESGSLRSEEKDLCEAPRFQCN